MSEAFKPMMDESMARTGTQELAMLIGRVLMSAPFVWAGYTKLIAAAATQAYFAKLGLPVPLLAWGVTVAIEFLGGLALLLGIQARVVGVILAGWCIATAVVAHTDFADRNMQIHFLKNVIMAGGFLYVAMFGAGAYTIWRAIGWRPPATYGR
jgi:putative oxidoreductase